MSIGDFVKKLLSSDGEWYAKSNYLNAKPGSIHEYSNVGATLAAYILEEATGESFDDYTTKHILEPLEMSSSGWAFNDIDLKKHSVLYLNPNTPLPKYSLITYPDGGLLTNVIDLSRYLTELIKGQSGEGTLLKKESYSEVFSQQLTSQHFPGRDKEDDYNNESKYNDEYNSGIFMGFTPTGYIGHTGGDPGIAAYMFFNPETKIGRILMINTSVINSEGITQFYSIWNTLEKYESHIGQQ